MEWLNSLPSDAAIEVDGKPTPVRELEFVKSSPDLPTFIKTAFDAHREVGRRIPLNVTKPEEVENWRKEHLPKLHKAGILEAPAADPKGYFQKWEKPPSANIHWDDEMAGVIGDVLHKAGAPASLGPKLSEAWTRVYGERAVKAAQELEKTWNETVEQEKAKYADKYNDRYAAAERFAKQLWGDAAEMKEYPDLLPALLALAPLAAQDTSFVPGANRGGGSGVSGEDAKAELARIVSDKTHPKHEGYWKQDPAVMKYIDDLYKKAHGEGQVNVSDGITVKGAA